MHFLGGNWPVPGNMQTSQVGELPDIRRTMHILALSRDVLARYSEHVGMLGAN